jgi:hypothetical protein
MVSVSGTAYYLAFIHFYNLTVSQKHSTFMMSQRNFISCVMFCREFSNTVGFWSQFSLLFCRQVKRINFDFVLPVVRVLGLLDCILFVMR